jgi:hypothetical protein
VSANDKDYRDYVELPEYPIEVVERLSAYLNSPQYSKQIQLPKHWKERERPNMDAFKILSNKRIFIDPNIDSGLSHRYLANFKAQNNNNSFRNGIEKRIPSGRWKEKTRLLFLRQILAYSRMLLLRYSGYEVGEAFDPVKHFNKLWPSDSFLIEVDVKKEFGDVLDPGIWKAAHIYNDLMNIVQSLGIDKDYFLEVGPGTGALSRLIKRYQSDVKITLIDLPQSIPYSFCSLLHAFPSASFYLPNEVESAKDVFSKELVFLTNQQISKIPRRRYSIGLNSTSFAEMRTDAIEKYFRMFRRVLKEENLFYTFNRIEKMMEYDEGITPIRFLDYPWLPEDLDYKYQLSPIEKGRTSEPFFVRACRLATPKNLNESSVN